MPSRRLKDSNIPASSSRGDRHCLAAYTPELSDGNKTPQGLGSGAPGRRGVTSAGPLKHLAPTIAPPSFVNGESRHVIPAEIGACMLSQSVSSEGQCKRQLQVSRRGDA